jgi:dTDP-L-rhamnose 4-epimerase
MGFNGDRVLVTGGAGFIGTALAQRFSDTSDRWVAVDSLLEQVHGTDPELSLPAGVELVRADVRDRDALGAVVREVDPTVVIHLAAETGTGQSLDEPSRHTDVNVTGTAILLEALTPQPPRRLVLTSSRAVYGEGTWLAHDGSRILPGPRTRGMLEAGQWDFPGLTATSSRWDRSTPNPSNVYGATKLAQEHLFTAWAASRAVATSILRLQNVYGPGQSPINPYTGITTLFVRLARAGRVIPVYEDGRIIRDFVFIDDVVQALGSAASTEGSVLADVGSGIATSIGQMASLVAAMQGAPAPEVTGQFRLGDVRNAHVDMGPSDWVRKGRTPTDLATGLARLAQWLGEQPVDTA